MSSPEDFRQLAHRMRQLTADTQRVREDFDRAEVNGSSADGSVHVTMRAGKMIRLDIDPSVMNHDNVYVASQVLSAVRQAEERSDEFLASRTSPIVGAVEEFRRFTQ